MQKQRRPRPVELIWNVSVSEWKQPAYITQTGNLKYNEIMHFKTMKLQDCYFKGQKSKNKEKIRSYLRVGLFES